MTNESQPAAKGGEQVLTVGVAQFSAALALYPAEDQEILEWLRGYLYQALGGQVQPLLQRLGVSYLDLHRVFSGRRSENYSGVIAAAAALRQRVAKDTPLVETDVTRAITDALDYARDHAAMTAIVGGTGRGKTLTAQVWAAANNHGKDALHPHDQRCAAFNAPDETLRIRRHGLRRLQRAGTRTAYPPQ